MSIAHRAFGLLAVVLVLGLADPGYSAAARLQPRAAPAESALAESVFGESGVWEGFGTNFVNMTGLKTGRPAYGGTEQPGHIRMKITVDKTGVISLSNAFVRPDGTQTGYEGTATMRVDGGKLMAVGDNSKDPNSGNRLENYRFDGQLSTRHAYVVEEYDEVLPEGRREHRRNDVHYILTPRGELLSVIDVQVDGRLLVFGHVTFKRCAPQGCR